MCITDINNTTFDIPQTAVEALYSLARARHGQSITPCGGSARTAITLNGNTYIFWYNDSNHSTHIVKQERI